MRTHRCIEILCSAMVLSVLSGCLTHEARITIPAEVQRDQASEATEGRTVIGGESFTSPPGPPVMTVQRGPLPQDVCVTAWRRDADGVIARGDAQVRTALPWWQRFPFDMITDFVPADLVIQTNTTVAITPVAMHTRSQLDAEAASAGYASVTPLPQSNP